MLFLILKDFFGLNVALKEKEIKDILVTEIRQQSRQLFDQMFKTLLYRTEEIAYLYCAAKESH